MIFLVYGKDREFGSKRTVSNTTDKRKTRRTCDSLYCIIDKSKIENILIVLRLKQLPHHVINQTKVRT
jgi:hypothetical protein